MFVTAGRVTGTSEVMPRRRRSLLAIPLGLALFSACVSVETQAPQVVVVVGAEAVPTDEEPQQVGSPSLGRLTPSHLWRFEEASGALAIDSAGGANGRMGPEVDKVRGCAGKAVALGGNARSAVDLGRTVGQFGRRDFTVSLWFRTSTTNRNNELLSNRADGSHGNFFNLRFAASKVIYELDEDTSGKNYVALESQPSLNDGVWHHVAARRRGTRATLFVDGERVAAGFTEDVTNIDNGRSLEVGSSSVANAFGLHFWGDVDEVATFDEALADDDIEALATGLSGCSPARDGDRPLRGGEELL